MAKATNRIAILAGDRTGVLTEKNRRVQLDPAAVYTVLSREGDDPVVLMLASPDGPIRTQIPKALIASR